jgi:proline iminopeptidase
MPIAHVNGTGLFYRVVGTGWPCLVLHGGLGLDHTYLHPWLDPLGDRLQLIYYDQRGNGRSARPPLETLTFAQFCADAEALRSYLQHDRIALLGHSYGGFIALEYALRYPERVSHLILLDTAAALDVDDQIDEQSHSEDLVELPQDSPGPTTDAELQQALERIAPLYYHTFDAQRAAEVFQNVVGSVSANARGAELLEEYNLVARLGEIHAPALCLAGDADFLCSAAHIETLYRGLANADLVILERCGHLPFIEQPGDFLHAVRVWLERTL